MAFPDPDTLYQIRPPSTANRASPAGSVSAAVDATAAAESAGGDESLEQAAAMHVRVATNDSVRMGARSEGWDVGIRGLGERR